MSGPAVDPAGTPQARFRRALVRVLPSWTGGAVVFVLLCHVIAAEIAPATGIFTTIGRGLLIAFSLLAGVVLGVAIGGLGALGESLAVAVAGARDLYGRVDRPDDARRIPLEDLPARYDDIAGSITGRMPLPRFGRRMLNRWLRRVLLENFVADATRRGRTDATTADARHWLLGHGLGLALRGVRDQIGLWRMLLMAALLLVGAFPLLLLLA